MGNIRDEPSPAPLEYARPIRALPISLVWLAVGFFTCEHLAAWPQGATPLHPWQRLASTWPWTDARTMGLVVEIMSQLALLAGAIAVCVGRRLTTTAGILYLLLGALTLTLQAARILLSPTGTTAGDGSLRVTIANSVMMWSGQLRVPISLLGAGAVLVVVGARDTAMRSVRRPVLVYRRVIIVWAILVLTLRGAWWLMYWTAFSTDPRYLTDPHSIQRVLVRAPGIAILLLGAAALLAMLARRWVRSWPFYFVIALALLWDVGWWLHTRSQVVGTLMEFSLSMRWLDAFLGVFTGPKHWPLLLFAALATASLSMRSLRDPEPPDLPRAEPSPQAAAPA